jgi:hypothetical protein
VIKVGVFLRQGDICFEKINGIPKGWIEKGNILEIQGEREDHVHRIEGVQVLAQPEQVNPTPAIIVVEREAQMTHPEHEPLRVPPGIYRVTQFREYQNPRPVD